MKLIASVILSLTLLDVFHCSPLIGTGDGTYKETRKSSSWGIGLDVNGGVGLEGGIEKGRGHIAVKPNIGFDLDGHRESVQVDINRAIPTWPNNFGPGYGYPYGLPNNPPNGIQYFPLYAPQLPQYPQQAVPPNTPLYAQQAAQPIAPLYAQQAAPRNAPLYFPQATLPRAPLYTPPYASLPNPQYVQQAAPQYGPTNEDDISQVINEG